MNKYQRLVITVAIIDLIVVFLFPPFIERTLAKNALTSFDGFYFLLSELGRRPVDTSLLSLELLWVAANTLSAWLLLGKKEGSESNEQKHAVGIAVFAAINIAIICLFPPFEQYSSLLRNAAPGFDSFYFVFGDRSARPIFLPLLHLEIFFVLINALALFLLFNAVRRGEAVDQERRIAGNAQADGPASLALPETPAQRAQNEKRRDALFTTLGRKEDRRHHTDPTYRGKERRTGRERRHSA